MMEYLSSPRSCQKLCVGTSCQNVVGVYIGDIYIMWANKLYQTEGKKSLETNCMSLNLIEQPHPQSFYYLQLPEKIFHAILF